MLSRSGRNNLVLTASRRGCFPEGNPDCLMETHEYRRFVFRSCHPILSARCRQGRDGHACTSSGTYGGRPWLIPFIPFERQRHTGREQRDVPPIFGAAHGEARLRCEPAQCETHRRSPCAGCRRTPRKNPRFQQCGSRAAQFLNRAAIPQARPSQSLTHPPRTQAALPLPAQLRTTASETPPPH